MYLPYNIYSKPKRSFKEYSDRVMVVFHGFLSAMPNHFFKALNQAFGKTMTVVGYNYDYFDVVQNKDQFDWFYKTALEGRTLYFAGTSLGGFWAQFLADIYEDSHVILSNPVVHPSHVLAQFLGKDNYSDQRNQTVTVTREKLKNYDLICLKKKFKGRRLILLTEDDDIQDYTIALRFFSHTGHTRILTFKQGGHTIDFKTQSTAMAAVESFINTQSTFNPNIS